MTDMTATDDAAWLQAVVRSTTQQTPDTLLIRLESAEAQALPRYDPGAHVAVQCGDAIRHYSLTGASRDAGVYELGVKLAPDSSGGSRWLFDHARAGALLRISAPRNHFPLVEGSQRLLFLSGGIGITPVLAMLYRLRTQGIRARLVHMCRAPEDLAFADWLAELGAFHDVQLHFDATAGAVYDLSAELERTPAEATVYCCGPSGMMDAVRAFGERSGRAEQFHFEYFSAPQSVPEPGEDAEFVVLQASTGRRIPVPPAKTMLAALREAGISMKSECEYGVCGWCAVGVLDGTPAHFDSYLTAKEKQANKLVLPCVSRCAGPAITLDI